MSSESTTGSQPTPRKPATTDLLRQAAREARATGGQPDIMPDYEEVIGAKKPKAAKAAKEPKGAKKPAAKPEAPAPRRENARQGGHNNGPAEQMRRDEPRQRLADGTYKPKPRINSGDSIAAARAAVRKHMAESDEEVLEHVRPTMQASDVDEDQSPESDEETEADENEETSPQATRARRQADTHLRDARQALLLEAVLSEDEIDELSDERLLTLGKLAKDATRARQADLRAANKAKGKSTQDSGSENPDATSDEPEDSEDGSDSFQDLAKKHFGEDTRYDWFRTKLAAFAKELVGPRDHETLVREVTDKVQRQIEGEAKFQKIVESLSGDDGFPQLATPKGLAKILPHMPHLANQGYSLEDAVERACLIEWKERGVKGKANAKAKTLATARDNGSPKTGSHAPQPKQRTTRDIARDAVRAHMVE